MRRHQGGAQKEQRPLSRRGCASTDVRTCDMSWDIEPHRQQGHDLWCNAIARSSAAPARASPRQCELSAQCSSFTGFDVLEKEETYILPCASLGSKGRGFLGRRPAANPISTARPPGCSPSGGCLPSLVSPLSPQTHRCASDYSSRAQGLFQHGEGPGACPALESAQTSFMSSERLTVPP